MSKNFKYIKHIHVPVPNHNNSDISDFLFIQKSVRKLMSAVVTHQAHPQSLVNTGKFPITDQVSILNILILDSVFISEYFQILPSEEFLTSHRTGHVKLRLQDRGMAAEPATSIPNLIQVINIVIKIYFANFIP